MENTMTNKDAPAYPANAGPNTYPGLTKREVAAIAVMQGFCARTPHDTFDPTIHTNTCAMWSVRFADALLAELEKDNDDSQ